MGRRTAFPIMAARILKIAPVRHRTPAPEPVALGVPQDLPSRLHFWRGASAKRYVHTVYSLIECPPLPRAMYLLVRRDKDGRMIAAAMGRSEDRLVKRNGQWRIQFRRLTVFTE